MSLKLDRISWFPGDTILLSVALLCAAAATPAPEAAPERCHTCLRVNTTCYNATQLLELDAPFRTKVVIPQIGILRAKNILYYSFEPNITDQEYFKVGFINLDDYSSKGILSAGQKFNFGTFDFDQDNGVVYLGGSDGIFALDTNANTLSPFSSRGDTIVSLLFRAHVYFVRYGEWKIVKKNGDNFFSFLEYTPIKNFLINKNYVTIFQTPYGLYADRGGDSVWLSKNAFFRGMAMDLDGVVYAWWIDGLYKVVIEPVLQDSRLYKVADITDIGAVTFDNDNNILFTKDKHLFRLTEVGLSVC